MTLQTIYDNIHYNIAPPFLVILCTVSSQIMAVFGTTQEDVTWSLLGNAYSWQVVGIVFLWALSSLWIPSKEYKGPTSPAGFTPIYRANGLQYFLFTLVTFIILVFFQPQIALDITENFPQIIATCNLIGFISSLYLLHKGKISPEVPEKLEDHSLFYEFYRGMEIHPRVLGVDVKQLIICRFSMTAWALLVIVFFVANWKLQEFSFANLVTVIILEIYLVKFFWWETGYFNTIDIIYDRAGYYIIWGCLVWVPCLYSFAWYFLATRTVFVGNNGAWLILFTGVLFLTLNYWVDWQKEYFRKNGGKCRLWGKQVTFITASYKGNTGGHRKSLLLTAGFWGIARHLNYTFELMIAVSWTLPALGHGIWPFIYVIFLFILLVHRVFRDERKCSAKYGIAWDEYCKKVPYRMIPGVF